MKKSAFKAQKSQEQFSWVPSPSCSPPGALPNKISCFVSTCVSSDNSFPSVRQEPSFRLWKGSPFLQHVGLTVLIFVGKVMSLLFNMLLRFVIAFLSRNRRLLISWLQSLTTVILESKKIKSVTVCIVSPIYVPRSDGTRCHDTRFLNVEF